MDIAVLIAAGLVSAFVAVKLWQAGTQAKVPTVHARVVDDQVDEILLFEELERMTREKAKKLAYARGASKLIEARADQVPMPWATPAAPDSPKA